MSLRILIPMVAALLVVAAAGPARASETGTPATLEDYLQEAVRNHPGLKASFERWNAAKSTVAREKGWPDPVLSYGYYLEPVQTAVGPQQHRIGLGQAIPWFGKLSARGSAAEQEALAAEEDYRLARLQLMERVASAYYEYAYLVEAIRVTGENFALLGQQESVARARYRTQSASYADLIKAQVEQGLLRDRLSTLEDRRSAAAARLEETVGREPTGDLPGPVSLDPPTWDPPTPEEIRARLDTDNPRLRAIDRHVEATRAAERAEGKNGMPDFNLGVQTILTGESELTSFDGQGQDAWILTLSMSLPLWQGQYQGARESARARGRMLEHEYTQARHDLRAQAEEASFGLRDAERRAELYGESLLPKARQALEATGRAFQTGNASFLDYVDAQRTLLMFQLDRARARADYGQRVLQISRLVGSLPIAVDDPAAVSAQEEESR